MNEMGGSGVYSFVKNTLFDNFLKLARVNILTGEYVFLKYDTVMKEEGYENIPSIYTYIEKQVADGLVLSEYAEEYLKFSSPDYVKMRVFGGDRRIIQSYKRKTHEGYMWVTFGIVVPAECCEENPWVVFYWREADSDTTIMVDALSTLSGIYHKILKINITEDSFQSIKVSQEERKQFVEKLAKISEWWQKFEDAGNVYIEDAEAYHEFTNIEHLRALFWEDSTRTHSCRYRRRQGDSWRWAQMELLSSIEYTDDNQILILYVKDIHEDVLKEERNRQALLDGYHRDALTRLYNRHKYNEDLEELAKGECPTLTCLYVDVNGLHELNNHMGHEKGDDMLCSVADALKRYFPEDSAYRIGGDEFVVLSTKLSKQTVEHIVREVRRDLIKDNYEISVGVESGSRELAVYKIVGAAELAMRADKELYYKQNGGVRKKRALNEELENTLREKKYAEKFLNVIANKFAGVYFVDLKHDTLQHIYIPYYFLEILEKTDYCFSEAMRIYMDKYVKGEYHEYFNRVLDYKYLKKQLEEEEKVAFAYQKVDGKWMYMRITRLESQNEEDYETIWIFSDEEMQQSFWGTI